MVHAYDARMPVRHVESSANPLVKELAALKDRRGRERSGKHLIEGAREAARALGAGVAGDLLLLSPALLATTASLDAWLERAAKAGLDVLTLSENAFARVSMRQNPDGVALVALSKRLAAHELRLAPGSLVLVLAGLEKPGNVGALLRSADAFGVDAVIVCEEHATEAGPPPAGVDLENPNLIRAAMGSSFTLPLAVGSPEETLAALHRAAIRLVATSPSATTPLWGCDLTGGVAVVLGREDVGLSGWWLERADESVSIPMRAAAADSLNVSVAGAVMLYEALRQRSW